MVFRMLAELLHRTDGHTWIQQYERSHNGWDVWALLRDDYDGDGAKEK